MGVGPVKFSGAVYARFAERICADCGASPAQVDEALHAVGEYEFAVRQYLQFRVLRRKLLQESPHLARKIRQTVSPATADRAAYPYRPGSPRSRLSEIGFNAVGEISQKRGRLQVRSSRVEPGIGFIHAWVAISLPGTAHIVYIGMTANVRLAQFGRHISALLRNPNSATHARDITNGLEAGNRYFVYARAAAVETDAARAGAAALGAEVRALRERFGQRWPDILPLPAAH